MQYDFAVIGSPIEHSLSPLIHHQFALQTGIELHYEKIQVEPAHFSAFVMDFFEKGGRGLNVTIPHKEAAFLISNEQSSRCIAARAANTLWQNERGLCADNTDGVGLLRDLSHYINLDLKDKKILLLGAGGAARGILAPLLQTGGEVSIANRTKARALQLQQDFLGRVFACAFDELEGPYHLIINATASSLNEKTLRLNPAIFEQVALCYDLNYRLKGLTPFVKHAQSCGTVAVDGLGMLIEQAAESFFIWHGIRPDPTAVNL